MVLWFTQFAIQTDDPQSASEALSLTYDALNQTLYVVGNFTGSVDFPADGFDGVETSSDDSSSESDATDAYIVGLWRVNGR